jgi:hypothetical protein
MFRFVVALLLVVCVVVVFAVVLFHVADWCKIAQAGSNLQLTHLYRFPSCPC